MIVRSRRWRWGRLPGGVDEGGHNARNCSRDDAHALQGTIVVGQEYTACDQDHGRDEREDLPQESCRALSAIVAPPIGRVPLGQCGDPIGEAGQHALELLEVIGVRERPGVGLDFLMDFLSNNLRGGWIPVGRWPFTTLRHWLLRASGGSLRGVRLRTSPSPLADPHPPVASPFASRRRGLPGGGCGAHQSDQRAERCCSRASVDGQIPSLPSSAVCRRHSSRRNLGVTQTNHPRRCEAHAFGNTPERRPSVACLGRTGSSPESAVLGRTKASMARDRQRAIWASQIRETAAWNGTTHLPAILDLIVREGLPWCQPEHTANLKISTGPDATP